jgi:hypothetical protein
MKRNECAAQVFLVSKLIRVIDVSVKQAVEKNREKSRVVDLWWL